MSADLWTQRHDLAVRQGDHPYKPGESAVPGAAGFHCHRLAGGVLEIALAGDLAVSEEGGRRSLKRPCFHLPRVALCVHRQVDVRISPVDFGERAGPCESLVDVEDC